MSHFKDSNLVRLLRLLRPEEHKKMETWLASPWVSSNKKLLPFCKLLLQYAPSFDQDALEKERVFKKIFPGKSYHNKLLNNLITDCTRQVESFLIHESIRTDKQQTDLLRQEMLRRENTKDFELLSLKLIQSLESKSVKSAEEHRELALLYMELYYQPFEHHRYHSEKDLLALMNQHLDAYYALLKCKLWHEAKDQSSITRKNNNVATNELLLLHFKNTLPNVAIQMYNLRLQRKPPLTWEDFLQFKNLYFKNQHLLSPDLQRNFFTTVSMTSYVWIIWVLNRRFRRL